MICKPCISLTAPTSTMTDKKCGLLSLWLMSVFLARIGAAPAFEENYPSPSVARRRSRGGSTSGNGIPIPGLSGAEARRRSRHTASISSSSIQLPSSSFTPSTPMTPNSLAGDSSHAISYSHGTTSFTTPSTSYPGLPVPHSTPAASPANGRQPAPSYTAVPPPTAASSMYTPNRLGPGLSLVTGTEPVSEPGTSSLPSAQSPASPVSLCEGKASHLTPSRAGLETPGILRNGNRATSGSASQSPISRPVVGGPGRPESRQQSPMSKD